MTHGLDLSQQVWTLRGWRQNDWELGRTVERAKVSVPDVGPLPARVPGSVRGALLAAGQVPDPMIGRNSRLSEWIENRHWTFSTTLDELALREDERIVAVFPGLDYAGHVLMGEREAGTFANSFLPHEFDITEAYAEGERELSVVFTTVPADLGQNGWTSRVRDWKPRFNYGWDWVPRIVQTGITEPPRLEVRGPVTLDGVSVRTDRDGQLTVFVDWRGAAAHAELVVDGPGHSSTTPLPEPGIRTLHVAGAHDWRVTPDSAQALYDVTVRLRADSGEVVDEARRRVGFRSVDWLPSEGSPVGATDWLCSVNGEPVFLQGVNWVPIRPDFADVTTDDYRKRLLAYREMGVNTLRVWGGAGLEREEFYDLCDELGILVWQELPLSSSGLDNHPPTDAAFAAELATIAASYVERRAHHPSLFLWGGGNELTQVTEPAVPGSPLTIAHPALAAAGEVFGRLDPRRRYIPTSPTGPRFDAREEEFGLGLHHDVHGPWEHSGGLDSWQRYWDHDDAVLRSEVGVAGASGVDLLTDFGLFDTEASIEELRHLWTHSSGWWLAQFDDWAGSTALADWVVASQQRQAEMLAYAARATKDRFPRSTGFIVWLGHDSFPCAVSLALLDYRGDAKPAADALRGVFRS